MVNESHIRKLSVDFLHLPLQAVECSLNGVDIQDDLIESNLVLFHEIRYHSYFLCQPPPSERPQKSATIFVDEYIIN